MSVEKTTATIDAGPVKFSVGYVDQDGHRAAGTRQPQQGVSIRVLAGESGAEEQVLRFDCFDNGPHYHYAPERDNERVLMDPVTAGNPIGWTLAQLRTNLPQMLRRAGCEGPAQALESEGEGAALAGALDEVEAIARDTALKWRRVVKHNGSAELAQIPGCHVVEVGNIRFGLEFRELPRIEARGMAIHVLSDVAGQEIELLAFDCFNHNAHYHYGPRNKDLRHYWDRTTVPDPLQWVLDRLAEGKLGKMIEAAGYPSIAADLDADLVAEKLAAEIAPRALAMRAANERAAAPVAA